MFSLHEQLTDQMGCLLYELLTDKMVFSLYKLLTDKCFHYMNG